MKHTQRGRAGWRGRVAALGLAAGLGLAASGAAAAKTAALLVGVSAYPAESVGDLQLTGPKFDVALMIETLRNLGVPDTDTIVLADGLGETWVDRKADDAPTRAAILAGLDRLAGKVGPGDTALIFLSGHGSQAPEIAPEGKAIPEADGMDEIFLPIDIGTWNDTAGAVENALVDDEIGAAVTRIRATGATVFLVVDACHSGTLTRGAAPDGQMVKKIDPGVLGIPADRIAAARAKAPALRSGGPGSVREGGFGAPAPGAVAEGGYVAFYAAHADQLALQRNMPKSFAKDVVRRPHGILTFNLVQALRAGRSGTYRDLAHAVMSGYQAWGVQAPVPLFEGDLAKPVLGRAETGPRRFPLKVEAEGARLEGGLVDGVEAGSVYVLSRADDPKAAPLGHVRVTAARTALAEIEPIERDGIAAPDLAALSRGRLLVATLVEPVVGLAYTVARPELPADASGPTANLAAALDQLAGRGAASGLAFVLPGEPADLGLTVVDGRLFLSMDAQPPVTTGREQSPSVPLSAFADPAKAADRLAMVLQPLAKARNLIRIADAVAEDAVREKLTIEAFLHREPPLPSGSAGIRPPDDRPCPALVPDVLPQGAVPFATLAPDGLDLVDLVHCDTAYFTLANRGDRPIDVTPLYVDGAGGISYMGPPEGLRLEPGAKPRIVPVRIVTYSQRRKMPLPVGLERLLFIAVAQADRSAVPADFRYLAQAAVAQAPNRGGGASPFRALLETAAFAPGLTRSAAVGGVGEAGVVQFRWRVRAPAGADP